MLQLLTGDIPNTTSPPHLEDIARKCAESPDVLYLGHHLPLLLRHQPTSSVLDLCAKLFPTILPWTIARELAVRLEAGGGVLAMSMTSMRLYLAYLTNLMRLHPGCKQVCILHVVSFVFVFCFCFVLFLFFVFCFLFFAFCFLFLFLLFVFVFVICFCFLFLFLLLFFVFCCFCFLFFVIGC
jgi:hypothetical protein